MNAYRDGAMGRVGKAMCRDPTMNEPEKSDELAVLTKSPNETSVLVEEMMEGRLQGNTGEFESTRCSLDGTCAGSRSRTSAVLAWRYEAASIRAICRVVPPQILHRFELHLKVGVR